MTKGKSLLGWVSIVAVVMVSLYTTRIHGLERMDDSSRIRTDVITINDMKVFGQLEKAPVEFLHDVHVEALVKKNKNCTACHPTEKNLLWPKFKRIKDTDRIEVMNIYHQGCIACHGEMKLAREKAGPVKCEGCHREQARYSSSRQPMGFDNSLHFRHSKAQENKCERCHHEYNEKEKKLIYVKEKEGTCRYCHKEETQDNRITMRLASHIACLDCHYKNLEKLAQGKPNGPIRCAGCHDPAAQQKIAKISPVPRMERKQPDVVMLKPVAKVPDPGQGNLNRMNWVPFDHKAHEMYNTTCRACHHSSMDACVKCHTLEGSKDGKFFNLQKAMHRVGVEASCIGCHDSFKADKRCAGCHATMSRRDPLKLSGCVSCHMPEPAGATAETEPKVMAAMLLEARKPVATTFADEDIPETIEIKALSKQYEPAKLPHRKIVQTLVKNVKDSKIAGYFHRDPGTICQGCHHNNPASKKPPACANCHGQPFDSRNLFEPGLQAAYHLQCMECHRDMGLENPVATDCTGCHKEKK